MTSVVLTIRRLLTIDKTCSHECYRAQEPWDRLQGSNIGPGMFALWTFLTRSKISEHKLQILNCVRSKSHFNRMTKTHTHTNMNCKSVHKVQTPAELSSAAVSQHPVSQTSVDDAATSARETRCVAAATFSSCNSFRTSHTARSVHITRDTPNLCQESGNFTRPVVTSVSAQN